MDGWIKIHRKILDWEWWDKPEMIKLLIMFICKANIEDKMWHGILIKRGQFISSLDALKVDSGFSIQKIRTCIKRFENTKELTIKSTNKYSIITICNYDDYQVFENDIQQTDQQTNNKQTTNKQQQLKNNKKDKNNILPIGSAPPNGNATLNSKARESFESHYKETFGNDYYWTAKDAGAMSQLLKKLKFQRSQKKLDNTDTELISALTVFLKSIDSGWIFENFSVTKINSQFNEILTKIYNKKNGKAIKNSSSRNEQKSREFDERKECVANLVKKLREQDLADM